MKYQASETAMCWQRSQAKAICFSVVMERPSCFADVAVSFSCSVGGRRGSRQAADPGDPVTGASSYCTCHVFLTLLKV